MDQTQTNTTFTDQTMTCKDCGREFIWTAGEQQFYADKGFTNPPSRCPEDRAKAKDAKMANRGSFPITCSNCSTQDTVPFEPRGDKPVLCRNCFATQRAGIPLTPGVQGVPPAQAQT